MYLYGEAAECGAATVAECAAFVERRLEQLLVDEGNDVEVSE